MIAALVQKDIKLFFRNQFFALITVLGLVLYIAFYFLLPAEVDETLPFAVYVEGMPAIVADGLDMGDGLTANTVESEEVLIEAVTNGDYMVGMAVSAEAFAGIMRGEDANLTLYYAPGTAPEVRDSIESVLSSRASMLTGGPEMQLAGVMTTTEVLGPPVDAPISMRNRVVPMLVLLILAVEVMGLATLIVEEIRQRTAQAVLITPLALPQFLLSKVIMGIGLAFVQVFLIMLLTGSIAAEPLLIITTLLLGCLLICGIGFWIASVASDMMSVMGWGILVIVVLALPAITMFLPSLASDWMNYIPSFYLVDTLNRTMNFGAGWADVSTNLLSLLVISVGLLFTGSVFLRRRFQ